MANAMRRMREAGFDVGDGVDAVVDPWLPIMGYTMRGEGGRFRITASGMAVRSGMLEGLLVHEMSHIVRMRTGHPSHDPQIIEEATARVADGVVTQDYQRKVLHDIVNNVEDLYADDIAFPVIRESGILTAGQASEFLQTGWRTRPRSPGTRPGPGGRTPGGWRTTPARSPRWHGTGSRTRAGGPRRRTSACCPGWGPAPRGTSSTSGICSRT